MLMSVKKFTPKGDRVLIKVKDETMGGLIIPDDLRREELPERKGVVVALSKNEAVTSELELGDEILFESYGVDLQLDGQDYLLLHICYIFCVLNKGDNNEKV